VNVCDIVPGSISWQESDNVWFRLVALSIADILAILKVFKNRWFARFAEKEGIDDKDLWEAIMAADMGLIDADYGAGVIKQRISRQNTGKSGGFRSVIFYRKGDKAFFVFGFPKKESSNLKPDAVRIYKKAAKEIFRQTDDEIDKLIKGGVFIPVKCHEKDQDV
jgi:hypothetical protein